MRRKSKIICISFICIFFVYIQKIYAQDSKAYQIPGVVYIGDVAKLVYPLDDFFLNIHDLQAYWDKAAVQNAELDIISVDVDVGLKALVVVFQAWKPGIIVLPPVTIGGEELSGLRLTISSYLSREEVPLVLAPQEGPLAVPGTFWLLFAAGLVCVILILAVLFIILYSKGAYKMILENAKIYKPKRRIMRNVKKIRKKLEKGRIENKDFLSALCVEFRTFVGLLYAIDCGALTSGELQALDIDERGRLSTFLSGADALRFSGKEPQKNQTLSFADNLLEEVNSICAAAAERASARSAAAAQSSNWPRFFGLSAEKKAGTGGSP